MAIINDPNKKKQAFTSLDNKNTSRRGTGFTNLSKILDANKQSRVGSTIGQGLSKDYGRVADQTSEKFSNFTQQSNQGRMGTQSDVQEREGILQDIFNKQTNIQPLEARGAESQQSQEVGPRTTPSRGFTAEGYQTPQERSQSEYNQMFTPTDEQKEKFESYRSAEYKGPQEIEGFENVQQDATRLGQLGNLIGSSGGRDVLLRRYVGTPGYTSGQRNLDSILLGNQNTDVLNRARRETQQLAGNVGRTQDIARGLAKSYQQEAERFKTDTSERLGGLEEQIMGSEAEIDPETGSFKVDEQGNPIMGTGIKGRLQALQMKEQQMGAHQQNLDRMLGLMDEQGNPVREGTATFQDNVTAVSNALAYMKKNGLINDQQFAGLSEMAKDALTSESAGKLGGAMNVRQFLRSKLNQVASENLNAEGVATREEAARINALRDLGGLQTFAGDDRAEFKEGSVGLKGLGDQFTRSEDMHLFGNEQLREISDTARNDSFKQLYGKDQIPYGYRRDPKTRQYSFILKNPDGSEEYIPMGTTTTKEGRSTVTRPDFNTLPANLRMAIEGSNKASEDAVTAYTDQKYGDSDWMKYAYDRGIEEWKAREVDPLNLKENFQNLVNNALLKTNAMGVSEFSNNFGDAMGQTFENIPLIGGLLGGLSPIVEGVSDFGMNLTTGLMGTPMAGGITSASTPGLTAQYGNAAAGQSMGMSGANAMTLTNPAYGGALPASWTVAGPAALGYMAAQDAMNKETSKITNALDNAANMDVMSGVEYDQESANRLKNLQDYITASLNKGNS